MTRLPIVHLTSTLTLPAVADGYTRFVLMSDTHGQTFDVPDGDVLIHAGGLTRSGRDIESLRRTVDWIADLPHRQKIIIAGNHDLVLDDAAVKAEPPDLEKPTDPKQEAIQVLEEAKQHGVTYLESSSCSILTSSNITWRLYGSPLTLFIKYHNGNVAFQRSRSVLQKAWSRIPRCSDILVTHSPPHRILDTSYNGKSSGCPDLRRRTEAIEPSMHVFGHIHEARGSLHDAVTGTLYVNASSCDQRMVRCGIDELQPIVVDMPNELAGRNASLANRILSYVKSWLPIS